MAVVQRSLEVAVPGADAVLMLGAVVGFTFTLGLALALWRKREALKRLVLLVFLTALAGGFYFVVWCGLESVGSWSSQSTWSSMWSVPWSVLLLVVFPGAIDRLAFGVAWALALGLLGVTLRCAGRGRWGTGGFLFSALVVVVAHPMVAGSDRESYGLASVAEEVFFSARWRVPMCVVAPVLGGVLGYGYLRGARGLKSRLPGLALRVEVMPWATLFLAASVLWGLSRVVSVAQAVGLDGGSIKQWHSVERVLVVQLLVPGLAVGLAAWGTLAAWMERQRARTDEKEGPEGPQGVVGTNQSAGRLCNGEGPAGPGCGPRGEE